MSLYRVVFILIATSTAAGLLGCSGNNTSERKKVTSPKSAAVSTAACAGNRVTAQIQGVQIQGAADFQSVVGNLVSATMDPQTLGSITSVELVLILNFDDQGQINSSNSDISITIKDSWVGQTGTDGQPIEPIQISHQPGESQFSGQWNREQKALTLQFSDEYGTIKLDAQTIGDELVGTIQFANRVAWDGSTPRSGVLGQIRVKSCQFQ